jgi:hypothetical protein
MHRCCGGCVVVAPGSTHIRSGGTSPNTPSRQNVEGNQRNQACGGGFPLERSARADKLSRYTAYLDTGKWGDISSQQARHEFDALPTNPTTGSLLSTERRPHGWIIVKQQSRTLGAGVTRMDCVTSKAGAMRHMDSRREPGPARTHRKMVSWIGSGMMTGNRPAEDRRG